MLNLNLGVDTGSIAAVAARSAGKPSTRLSGILDLHRRFLPAAITRRPSKSR